MPWLFECGGGKWGAFDAAATVKLDAAQLAKSASVDIDTPHGTLRIDLSTLTQTNMKTGRVRAVRHLSLIHI